MRGPRRSFVAASLLALAGFAACGAPETTAVRVKVTLESGLTVDQLRVVASAPQLTLDETLPRQAKGIASGSDVVVILAAAAATGTAQVIVSGRAQGAEVGRGSAVVTLAPKKTVTVAVTVRPVAACATDTHDCGGTCVSDTDAAHCGLGCVACPASTPHGTVACTADACTATCERGYAACGAACADLQTDAANCGRCGHACATGERCAAGACAPSDCTTGTHDCDGTCVADADPAHCGQACAPCTPPANATATCDGTSCGFTCGSGYAPCGQACCATSCAAASCSAGYANGGCCGTEPYCVGAACRSACGGQSEQCAADADCCEGYCSSGYCAPQSCASTSCSYGHWDGGCCSAAPYCAGQYCRTYCGNDGERCGTSNDCCNGNCSGGYCAPPSCASTYCNYGYWDGGCCASAPYCAGQYCRNYCASDGERCGTNNDCCNGNCSGGYCAPASCVGYTCAAGYWDGGCCSSAPYCTNYWSQPTKCSSTCGAASQHCITGNDCCSGSCRYNASAGWNICD